MPAGLYNTTGVPLIGPNSQAGSDALMQLYNPQRHKKTLQDFIQPQDRSAIDAVQAALSSGLDPSTAASLLSNLATGVTGDYGAYQQRRQDNKTQATDALMQLAQTNPNPEAASTYMDAFSQLHPGLSQQLSPTLEGLAGSLYPGGDTSPLFTGDTGAGGDAGLTPEDIAGVYQDAMVFAQGDATNGVNPLPLHDARLRIIGQLRAQGYSEKDIAQAYDAIGHAYQAVGGPVNAPITSQDRLSQMAAQAAPAPAGMAPSAPQTVTPANPLHVSNPLQTSYQGALSPWR